MQKRISFYLEIDSENHTAAFREARCKCPVALVNSDSLPSVAGICRDAAAHFLELAHNYEHAADFIAPDFTDTERAAQAAKMLDDHKNIFAPQAMTPEQKAQAAADFVEAIRTIAAKPENLENLESYLSRHFPAWLQKYANDPESLAAEMREFANMTI